MGLFGVRHGLVVLAGEWSGWLRSCRALSGLAGCGRVRAERPVRFDEVGNGGASSGWLWFVVADTLRPECLCDIPGAWLISLESKTRVEADTVYSGRAISAISKLRDG